MKFVRFILFPVVLFYYMITWMRNWLYDIGLKSSKTYDFPVICVGNLSTGGTGKSPMIEYLIRLLQAKKSLATLSRGYKRQTKGFVLADESASVSTIGDEPFQFYKKFSDVKVAVDGDRQNGISQLRRLKDYPEVVLLDDAYQHRKVTPGFIILLTAYHNLYYKDWVLPTGNLREPRTGVKRANVVVVTKCPESLSESKKTKIEKRLKLKPHQSLFFSIIQYANEVVSSGNKLDLITLPKFTLVTGIANSKPLVTYLKNKGLEFEHLEFADHYNFKPLDVEKLQSKALIVTTEKDYMRLSENECLISKLFYLPIEVKIDKPKAFESAILRFVGL